MSRSIALRLQWMAPKVLFALTLSVAFVRPSPVHAQSLPQTAQPNEIQFPGTNHCTDKLQECIDYAAEGSIIRIAPGTYTASIVLNRPVSLIGTSAETTIINAENGKRVLQVQGKGVNGTVEIAHLTINGGNADGSTNHDQLGGGILVEDGAIPQLHDLIIQNNFARTYGGGIAIVSTEQAPIPSITIRNSIFKNNTTAGTGGGLCSNAGQTIIAATEFSANHAKHGGGALINGPFTLSNIQMLGNSADEFGGGIYGGYDSKMDVILSTLKDSLFDSNSAGYQGGGAYVFNTVVEHDSFQHNQVTINSRMSGGGGLTTSSVVTVTKSVFLGNTAPDGGGIAGLGGKIWVNNTLFVDNLAGDAQTGAAFSLVNASPTTRSFLTHLTIVDRTEENNGAAVKTGDGEVRLTNSIVVNHTTAVYNSNGRLLEQNNLYFDNAQNIAGDTIRSSNSIYADPLFADPASLNFHLLATSAAIDAGATIDITDDFDGDARPAGGAPDIGYDEVTVVKTPIDEPGFGDTAPSHGIFLPLVVR